MAATTKLTVFNQALQHLGAAPLTDATTANARQTPLAGAFDHAVEYVLSRRNWSFARRRAIRVGFADTSFPPYTYRYARPSDYLRKVWLKASAEDANEIPHTEAGTVFYGFATSALLEYMSDDAANYDPANWPPQFTKVIALYLAALVGPSIARLGADAVDKLRGEMESALDEANAQESAWSLDMEVSAEKQGVLRLALQYIGQELMGSVAIQSQADKLRWQMLQSWDESVKYILEQGAWNFATRQLIMDDGDGPAPGGAYSEIIEGYSLGPAVEPGSDPEPADFGYAYAFSIPSEYVAKISIRDSASSDREARYKIMGRVVYANANPLFMEYVAADTTSLDPANWPPSFKAAVASYLAFLASPQLVVEEGGKGKRIALNEVRDKLEKRHLGLLMDAQVRDAVQQAPEEMDLPDTYRARRGSWTGRGPDLR